MREVPLQVEKRDGRGKGPARRLRMSGRIPATMYGDGIDAVALAVDAKALGQALGTEAGINALLDLHLGEEQHLAMARELTRDPIKGSIIHVDFLRVDRNKTIEIDVPVHLEGEPPGLDEGGVLEHQMWSMHVSCLPTGVPERIDVDVSRLGIGDAVHVSDVIAPEGVTILTPAEEVIATVVVPQVLEVEAPETAEGEELEGEAAEGAEGEGEGGEEAAEGESGDEG